MCTQNFQQNQNLVQTSKTDKKTVKSPTVPFHVPLPHHFRSKSGKFFTAFFEFTDKISVF